VPRFAVHIVGELFGLEYTGAGRLPFKRRTRTA
jgi:hypothetical protein